ncbi:TonB-dependent receptor plug domain-containing protein [Sphingomonas sp. MMS24-JH45]
MPYLASAAEPQAASEDIVVTARRRSEPLQRVPIAVTALSGEALEARGFNSVTDIERSAPSLKFTSGNGGNSGGFNAFIRGVGEPDFIVTSDPAVALYIDGVYVSRSYGADLDLLGVARERCCAVRRAHCSARTRSVGRSARRPTCPTAPRG